MHERLEHIILSACEYYKEDWRLVIRPKTEGISVDNRVKAAICQLVINNITNDRPWEYLAMTAATFRNSILHCDYGDCMKIQKRINSKELVYKKAI